MLLHNKKLIKVTTAACNGKLVADSTVPETLADATGSSEA